MIHTRTLVLILASVAFSAAGQLLLMAGSQRLSGLGSAAYLMAAATDLRILAGLASWIASTVCWLYVLQVAPLSRAYAITSLTYVLVPLASVYFFDEQLRRVHVAGIVLVLIGVALLLSGD
jgi:drug/metabolite transporter (DMT)-like permease